MPRVEANGVDLYYEITGDHGDPVVLIHGSWGDHRNWDLVVRDLSKNFRVLTYDRRGHSQSEKTATQGSYEEDAQDAAALIAQLDLSRAHVVGNSSGSSIALKLATIQPSVFRTLIVHEPPLWDLLADDPSTAQRMVEMRNRMEDVARMLKSGDRSGGARLFAETLAHGPGGWDKMSAQLKQTFVSNADTFLDQTRDPTGLNVDLKALSQFSKPTLLTYGGKSPPAFRPVIEKLAKVIPNSKVEIYPDDGHTPHNSNPSEFVRRVARFAESSG